MRTDAETMIRLVNGSMALEGMPLTDEDKKRIRESVLNPGSVETVIEELVRKHSKKENEQ